MGQPGCNGDVTQSNVRAAEWHYPKEDNALLVYCNVCKIDMRAEKNSIKNNECICPKCGKVCSTKGSVLDLNRAKIKCLSRDENQDR